jgi:hypothetical protein
MLGGGRALIISTETAKVWVDVMIHGRDRGPAVLGGLERVVADGDERSSEIRTHVGVATSAPAVE